MTPEDLDALIRKIIIPQTKPISTGNSYFRRMGDKRRWGKLIRSERLKNPGLCQRFCVNSKPPKNANFW